MQRWSISSAEGNIKYLQEEALSGKHSYRQAAL
jgi:hypothetical protein